MRERKRRYSEGSGQVKATCKRCNNHWFLNKRPSHGEVCFNCKSRFIEYEGENV